VVETWEIEGFPQRGKGKLAKPALKGDGLPLRGKPVAIKKREMADEVSRGRGCGKAFRKRGREASQ